MKKIYVAIFLLVLFACDNQNGKQKITIAAAASTQFAVNELADEFGKKYNIELVVITGSSGKLTTQIMNGAPYDIFFSANMNYPNKLFDNKNAIEKPKVYGFGVPVLWTLDMNLKMNEDGQFLLDSDVKKVAIANPKNAPYGSMAVKFMKDKGVYDSVQSKLVYGESISLVNEYILNKTATIGVSAKSIVLSPRVKEEGNYLPLSKKYWIEQGIVELSNTESSEIKKKFMNFVFSDFAQNILNKYGYEK